MAKLSSDKKYVTVQSGDTLSAIYSKYKSYTSATSYQQLASWNGISNPNVIKVGQKIYFAKSGATTSTAKKAASNCVTNVYLGLMPNSTKELLATWEWSKQSTTASYTILWKYKTLNNKWLVGDDTSTSRNDHYYATSRQYTFNIPDTAKQIAFRVLPVAQNKTKTETDKNGKKTTTETDEPKWKANWNDWVYYTVGDALETPSAPTVEFKGLTLTATLSYTASSYAKKAQFQIYKNGNTHVAKSGELTINTETKKVSWSYTVAAGNKYMVRAKVIGSGVDSAWSPFSEEKNALPTPPSGAPTVVEYKPENATGNTHSVRVSWNKVSSATSYKVQYIAEDKTGLDQPNRPSEVTVEPSSSANPTPPTSCIVYDIDGGKEWFFRVCAVNEAGTSKWTNVTSITLGSKPGVPTTWSSTTKATVPETIRLYWIHNSTDGSTQAYSNISITIDGAPILDGGFNVTNLPDTNTDELSQIFTYPSLSDPYLKVYRIYDGSTKSTQLYADFITENYFDPATFDGHALFKWQVKTAGITSEYSKYSTEREIDIYAHPQLELTVTNDFTVNEDNSIELGEEIMDTLTSFPFYVKALATPEDQTPIGYHLSVIALDTYETIDQIGNDTTVSAGDEVYSQNFDISTPLLVPMSASNIDLENGMNYKVVCTAYMDSGLSAAADHEFYVSWTEERYAPGVEYSLDSETFSLSIHPYCEDPIVTFKSVTKTSKQYSVDTDSDLDIEALDDIYLDGSGELVRFGLNARGSEIYYCIDENSNYLNVTYSNGVYSKTSTKLNPLDIQNRVTTTGEEVLLGIMNGETLYYCHSITNALAKGVTLSVYRREFDGSFVEIESGIDNTTETFVIDPHPALDYGRYRIVATDVATGAISYYDPPGFPINGKSVIIQWDEDWSSFEGWSEDPLAEPPWTGSLLKLPYNIDVTDTTSPEVTHVNYAGRKHPVSYHGTHLGETATWNVTVPKEDTETLYQLRRLKVWMGNVYVREPSGTGYWATLTVSDPRKHNDVLVQVSLNITRVEGGI